MKGSVRLAASSTRRITTPHAPPDRWCTIESARDPSAMPIQKTYASRYDLKKCSRFAAKPTAQSAMPARPTSIANRCRPATRGGAL